MAIKNAPDGKLQDGGGLVLAKSGTKGKWIFRYSHLGRRREMGLGQWPGISLAEARKARDGWASELAAGRDPITQRDAARALAIEERDRSDPNLAELIQTVFEAKQAGLRGGGARGMWMAPLRNHIIPKLGGKVVSSITRHDIAAALKPIWRTKHPTAEKARDRLRIVLREGRLMGFAVDPFEVDAAVRILGEVHHKATPIPSTPWQDIPALYEKLGDTGVSDCLRFMILTAMRMDACSGMRADEVAGNVWTVPADRMKGTEKGASAFRVPLSPEALRIISRRMEVMQEDGLLFGSYTGRRITSTALEKRLRVLEEEGRPHGFRTSFRTWCQDHDISWDVAETALGHVIGSKIERSYARSDLLDRRRIVMDAWADYVSGAPAATYAIRAARQATGSA